MKELYEEIKSILDSRSRSFSWLAENVGFSRQGLKVSLVNGNIKYETLLKIANLLEVSISRFFVIPPTEDNLDKQVHYLRYQEKLNRNYQLEIDKEIEILKKRIFELEKEVESYRKMIDVLHSKNIKNS